MSKTRIMFALAAMSLAVALTMFVGACSSPTQPAPQEPAAEAPVAAPVGDAVTEDEDVVAPDTDAVDEETEDEAVDVLSHYSPEARPYADSPYAAQIDAGLVFVVDNVGELSCDWMDYLVMDYLQRKFGLDESLAAAHNIDADGMDSEQQANYHLHARLGVPGHRVEDSPIRFEDSFLFSEYEPAEGQEFVDTAALKQIGLSMSGIMLRAMYCDVEPVDAEFVAELMRQATETRYKGYPNNIGGYVVSHMALSYQWLRELGCADAFDVLADAEETFADLMVGIVENQNVVTDLGMEAMVMLHYIGQSERIEQEWVEQVAQAQMSSGAWDRHGGTESIAMPQCHTTAFALWVLLEDALPDAPEVPWLR